MTKSFPYAALSGLLLSSACFAPAAEPASDIDVDVDVAQTADRLSTTIAIQTDGPAELVLYREGTNGNWLPAQPVKRGTYAAQVNGPYTVMVVCQDELGASTTLTSQTPEDEPLVEAFCGPLLEEQYEVSGTMLQSGTVALGNTFYFSTHPNWGFSLPALAGRYDLVASSADRAMLRRGLAVTGNLALPPIDLAQQGMALVPSPIAVTNPFPGEALSVRSFVVTPRSSQLRLHSGAFPAKLMPSAALLPGEHQEVSLRSTIGDASFLTSRSYRRPLLPGESLQATLWDPFTSLSIGDDTNGDVQVSWTGTEPFDQLFLHAYDSLGNSIGLSQTRSYLAATGVHQALLDTHVPGYRSEWRVDPSLYNRTFAVLQDRAVRHGYQRDDFDLSSGTGARRSMSPEQAAQLSKMRARAEALRGRLIQE